MEHRVEGPLCSRSVSPEDWPSASRQELLRTPRFEKCLGQAIACEPSPELRSLPPPRLANYIKKPTSWQRQVVAIAECEVKIPPNLPLEIRKRKETLFIT
jgi:hypothetical protein